MYKGERVYMTGMARVRYIKVQGDHKGGSTGGKQACVRMCKDTKRNSKDQGE